jgi:16S rRNA G966 N2-methylase RsmD
VREAWFSILQRSLRGARVLDLYAAPAPGPRGAALAGGERGLRGGASQRLAALKANIKSAQGRGRATIHRARLKYALQLQSGQYDVAFADPPYAKAKTRPPGWWRCSVWCRSRVFSIEHPPMRRSPGTTPAGTDTAVTFIYAP